MKLCKLIVVSSLLLCSSLVAFSQNSRFTPSYSEYFTQALKEKGPVTAVLATLDRRVRDTRVGWASCHYFREDGRIHEDFFGPLDVPYHKTQVFDFSSIQPVEGYRPMSEDEEFIKYLLGNNLSGDAVWYLHGTAFAPSDTLDYYKGVSLYTAGGLEQASASFEKVDAQSVYYTPSVYFDVVCKSYLKQYDEAAKRLMEYKGPDDELKNYELAALSLLRDDKGGYERYSEAFSYSQYALGEGEKVFDRIYKERFVDKGKSAWLAAGLSAIVPGLGKMYVGCYGEGAASFLLGVSFTGFAVESWVKNGGKDWRTILFTAAASLLHLSNIYGSYISVGIYDNYLKDAQNQTIVFNIHVPVRAFFK